MAALSTIATLAMIGTGLAQGVSSLTGRGPREPKLPEPTPPPRQLTDLPDDQKRRLAAIARRRAAGAGINTRSGTMSTGSSGTSGAAPVERKTLLGY